MNIPSTRQRRRSRSLLSSMHCSRIAVADAHARHTRSGNSSQQPLLIQHASNRFSYDGFAANDPSMIRHGVTLAASTLTSSSSVICLVSGIYHHPRPLHLYCLLANTSRAGCIHGSRALLSLSARHWFFPAMKDKQAVTFPRSEAYLGTWCCHPPPWRCYHVCQVSRPMRPGEGSSHSIALT